MDNIFHKIPENRFTIEVEKSFLFNLIERAIKKIDKTGKLSKILIKRYDIDKYSQRELADYLRKWQRNKNRISLSYYFTLCKFLGIKTEIFYPKITKLYSANSSSSIKFKSLLSKELVSISELIRVEGYMDKSKHRIILENTDMELINKAKKCMEKIGINNIIQDLRVKISVPIDNQLEDIKVINAKSKKPKAIYQRILKLKKGLKKEVIFVERNVSINDRLEYLLKLKDIWFKINIFIPSNGKITSESNLKFNSPYQRIIPSFILTIWNGTLFYILNKIFMIQRGKKSRIIFIPLLVKNLPLNHLKEAVGLIFAAESTVTDSSIKLTSLSKRYLVDLKFLLEKFNITSKVDKKKTTLLIFGNRNFQKIKKNFNLVLTYKSKQLNKLLNSNIQKSPKGLSPSLYLKSLSELKKANWKYIQNNANRIGNSSGIYLRYLLQNRYIETVKNTWPREYILTNQGKKYLELNKMYWLD